MSKLVIRDTRFLVLQIVYAAGKIFSRGFCGGSHKVIDFHQSSVKVSQFLGSVM